MAWLHRIAAALQELIKLREEHSFGGLVVVPKISDEERVPRWSGDLPLWFDPTPLPWVLANSNPILVGAGSVFNLAGTVDEPIVGLVPPGVPSTDEALELFPFYVDQAERILGQAEEMTQESERILRMAGLYVLMLETERRGTDQEKTRQNLRRA